MTFSLLRTTAVAALLAGAVAPALAQRQPPSPEQRIERLERQLQQVQRQVFPRGAPAATAGFSDDPAATQSSVRNLDDRLGALERQLTDILRQSEENGNRTRSLEAEVARLRTDQESRIAALESAARAAAEAAQPVTPAVVEPLPSGSSRPAATTGTTASGTTSADPATDPGEEAYSEGFRLWNAGNYSRAITSLRAFTSAYPKHRRVSFANNLVGRSLLDQGQARAAAEVLLANYRSNPKGERAPDSLFYLGQALMKLNQPSHACKAYEELEAVYRNKLRDELKKLLPPAKAEANCS